MSASTNEALVRRAIDAIWNRGDFDVADELFATDYVNHNGLISDIVDGPEAVKISAALHRLAFPDLLVVIRQLRTDGETMVLRWIATRAPGGHLRATAACVESESLTGITRIRVAAGRIKESWTEWDRMGVLRELGVIPAE